MPTSRPPGRSPPSGPVVRLSRPRVGSAERDDAADPAAGGPDRDRRARADLADDPGDRRLERVDDVAGGDAPARPPGEEVLAAGGAARPPPVPPAPTTRPSACQRSPGRGSTGSATTLSSSRGSRRRSAIGAPTTTEAPASTIARSPGESAKTASTGASMSWRTGTRSRSVAGAEPAAGPRDPPWPRRGASRYPSGAPAATVVCQPSSSSRRRSARSGSRIGTSRRSTRRPARPADDVDREVAPAPARGGRCPGTGTRRSRSRPAAGRPSIPPGTRSIGVRPRGVTRPGRAVDRGRRGFPALRPVRRPAGVTTLPSGARRSSARSAMTARRSSGSGIEPSGPSRRAWSSA